MAGGTLSGRALVVGMLALVGVAATFFFVFLRGDVDRQHRPSPPPEGADAPGLTGYCDEFAAFTFACGIGRPELDPAHDLAAQRRQIREVQERVADNCRQERLPYDERLIRCYLEAGGYCDAYQECVDQP